MKEIKRYIPLALGYLLCVLLSRYDIAGKLWFVNLMILLVGTYFIIKPLRPRLEEEAKLISGGADLIGFFLGTAVPVALIAVFFIVGYAGTFQSDVGTLGDTLLAALVNGLLSLLMPLMAFVFVTLVVMVPLGALLSCLLHYDAQFSTELMLAGWEFLLLCYLCGVVDIWRIMDVLSNILDLIK